MYLLMGIRKLDKMNRAKTNSFGEYLGNFCFAEQEVLFVESGRTTLLKLQLLAGGRSHSCVHPLPPRIDEPSKKIDVTVYWLRIGTYFQLFPVVFKKGFPPDN